MASLAPAPARARHALTRSESVVVVLTLALATVGLVWWSTGGVVRAATALGAATLVLGVAVLGLRRTGVLLLGLSFFFAAGSRGEALAVAGPSLSASDALFAVALVLLLPSLVTGLPRFALLPVAGLGLMFPAFLIGTALSSEAPAASLKTLAALAVCMILIPATLIALRPSRALVQRLAWCFVAGHVLDTAYSIAKDPTTGIRHQGLTQHPNAFAESGLIAFALLLYLVRTTRRPWLAYAAMAVSLASIYLSGSRGATVALAAVILAIPVIERTPLAGTLFAVVVAAVLYSLEYVVPRVSPDSAIGRLVGGQSSSASDTERVNGINYGLERFGQHPFVGSGLSDLFSIHVNLLEVAVGGGIIAVAGFALVILSIGLPVLSKAPERRLCYVLVAFVVFSATAPALADRPMWLAISLSLALFHGFRDLDPEADGDSSASRRTAEQEELVTDADHVPHLV